MWIFTDQGFFSAVAHRDFQNCLMVRARVRQDLESLAKRLGKGAGEISSSRPSDYPYRMTVTRTAFAGVIAEMLVSVDYDNFKNSVTQKQGIERHDLYMRVGQPWLTLNDAFWRV